MIGRILPALLAGAVLMATDAQFAGQWTGRWDNQTGESGADTLVLSEGQGGTLKGTWSGKVPVTGRRTGPASATLQGATTTRAYDINIAIRGDVLTLAYTARRLDAGGTYEGRSTLKQAKESWIDKVNRKAGAFEKGMDRALGTPPSTAAPSTSPEPAPAPATTPGGVVAPASRAELPMSSFEQGKWASTDVVWQPLASEPPVPGNTPRAVLPEGIDINHLTPLNYQSAIIAAKEAMRLLMGPLSAQDEKRFDTKWAPLFEYPCQPVIEYFNRLNPLLNRLLAGRAALNQAVLEFNNSWEEATEAVRLEDEDGVREAMQVCKVHRNNISGLKATIDDLAQKIQALGEPPDPLAHKAKARAEHKEASQAMRDLVAPARPKTVKPPGEYWILSKIQPEVRANQSGGDVKYTFSTAEGTASGSMNQVQTDQVSKTTAKYMLAGSATWKPLPRVAPDRNGDPDISVDGNVECSKSEWSDPAYPCSALSYQDKMKNAWSSSKTKPTTPVASRVFFEHFTAGEVTLAIMVATPGGWASYTYTYVARRLTADQAAEIQAKADADLKRAAAGQAESVVNQAAAQAKAESANDALALMRANQVYFQAQVDEFRKQAATNPAQRDRFNFLAMVADANLQAERDSESTLVTGEWTRTRTGYDEWNAGVMAANSQQTVAVTSRALTAEAAIPRLIGLLPKELRYTENDKAQTAVSQAIAAGDFEGVNRIVRSLSERVHGQAERDAEIYGRAAAAANYVVGATEALKTGADQAMFALSFVPGGGVVYPWYLGATGYVEGGPVHGIKEFVASLHPVTTTMVAAYDGYERTVTNPATGQTVQGGMRGAATEAGKSALTAFVMQKAISAVVGPYLKGARGKSEAPTVEQLLGQARRDSRVTNGRAKVSLFKQRSDALLAAERSGASASTVAGLRVKAEEAAKVIKCDYTAKMALNQASRNGDTATMNRYLTHESKIMTEVQQNFEQKLAADGWAKQELKQFSNSASKGKAGIDVDLGVVEPPQLIRNANGTLVSNPEWHQWRKTLTQRNVQRTVYEYQAAAQAHLDKAFEEVVGGPGRGTKEAFVNFTTSAHKESYLNTAWLGKQGATHADFENIDPAMTQQATDVTMFKIMHNPNAKAPAKLDPNRLALTKDPIPDYLFFQEQCRTVVKDMNTKLIGSTGPAVLPQAPLAKVNKGVQRHVLDVRKVMDDFATNKIGPIEADRKLKNLTGGEGLAMVLREYETIMNTAGH